MDINTFNTIRDLINATSLAVLFLVIGVALIGLYRPKALRFVFKEFARRKYFAVGGIFLGFLCGTIYTATQADYSSYNSAGQDSPAVQSQTSLPEDTNEDATEAEVQGASTEQESTTSNQSHTNQTQSAQPTSSQTRNQDNGNPKNDSRQSTDQSKSDKNCRITQLLFVCI